MKHKLHSFLIGVVVFFMSISPAFAAGTAFALGLASTMADIALNYYIGTQEQRATALTQLNKFWADSGSGGSVHPTYVTYQSLSDLCLELNENGFPCLITAYPTTSSTNGDYCIRGNGDVVVPGVIPTTSNKYSIDGRILHTANGALYPILAKDPNQDSLAYKPIYDKIKDIYNYYTQTLTTKLNNIISYVDGMEGYVDGIEGYVDGVEGKLDTIITNTSSTTTKLDRLVVTTDGVTQTAAELLRLIFDRLSRLAVTRDNTTYTVAELEYNIYSTLQSVTGYVDGVESTLNTISSRVNTTNTRLNTVNSNLTSIGGKIDNIEIPEPIDYTDALSEIISNTTDDIYVTLYTDDSNGNQYSTLSYRPEIIDGIISYLTTNMQNKPLKVLSRDGIAGVVSQDVRYFMLANFNNGYVRLRVKLEDGTYGFAYLSTPNRVLIKYDNTYVDDSTFYQKLTSIETAINSISTDNSSVVAAIDRIYDWLDNADLATNATIIQVVEDYSHDVNHSVDWASQILDLFKRVYIFDRPAPSFSGILDYFSSLGSD